MIDEIFRAMAETIEKFVGLGWDKQGIVAIVELGAVVVIIKILDGWRPKIKIPKLKRRDVNEDEEEFVLIRRKKK